MKTNDMEPFRNQLQLLDLQLRTDADTLADEAFQTTDSMAMGNLSNVPVEDRAERAVDNYCEETTIGLIENADARLREITAALERIECGTFGSCEVCTQEISVDRLRTVPFARNAQSAPARHNKGSRHRQETCKATLVAALRQNFENQPPAREYRDVSGPSSRLSSSQIHRGRSTDPGHVKR